MARLIHRRTRLQRRERGFAMIAIISLIALISSYLIANVLARTNAELSNERERRSMDALRQAKAALIAYAASEQWQLYKGQVTNQPGGLPCPDLDDDGDSQGLCSNALSRVGRLPWKTLGVDDLRDSSGERLWYAVSSNFRKLSGTTVINSDTQGLLTATGTAPASNVVAIVFAPGAAIQGQNRDPANAAAHNAPASYLEGFTAGATDYTFTTNALPSDTFNDRLLVITQADLMSAVEPAVAARIERDIKPYLQTYFSQWGAFPFPAAFANPSPGDNSNAPSSPPQPRTQGAYAGDPTQTSGLLPITASLIYPWTAVAIPTKISGTGNVTVGGAPCVTVALPGWQCTFTVSGQGFFSAITTLRVRVQGEIGANAGISFAKLADLSAVVTTINGVNSTFALIQYGGSLTSFGVGTVSYEATLPIVCVFCAPSIIRITIPDVTMSPLTSASDPAAGWFIANEWYRQTYYAVSQGYLPGGGGFCTPLPGAPSCLTVSNLSPVTYPTPNDKRAILVFAGRALANTRPSANLGDYLEGQNSTPADYIFEHRTGAAGLTASVTPSALINDRVVVVSP